MTVAFPRGIVHRSLLSAAIISASGCASVSLTQSLDRTNAQAVEFTQGKLKLALTEEQRREMRANAGILLKQPLSQSEAIEVALSNSPGMQTLIAQNWANAANAAQSGRIANPVFTFERFRFINELELGRLLSFGLLDLATLPRRYSVAQRRIEQAQLQLTTEVIEQITEIRQAWVKAVAAAQSLTYAKQVSEIAEASAELARRMQKVGNFNKLQRARQQAFYADATTQLALASHAATASRETLVRALGLTDEQALQLQIPDRLPDLPKLPRDPKEVGTIASQVDGGGIVRHTVAVGVGVEGDGGEVDVVAAARVGRAQGEGIISITRVIQRVGEDHLSAGRGEA